MRTLVANRKEQPINVKINRLIDVYNGIRVLNDIFSSDVPDFEELSRLN